jgi:cytochrome c oxidase subunit I
VSARYHGGIGGVTLALIGVTCLLLPRMGYERVNALLQAWLYGGGQMLHIAGLVWSGGYGVQSTVSGAAQALDSLQKVVGMD